MGEKLFQFISVINFLVFLQKGRYPLQLITIHTDTVLLSIVTFKNGCLNKVYNKPFAKERKGKKNFSYVSNLSSVKAH